MISGNKSIPGVGDVVKTWEIVTIYSHFFFFLILEKSLPDSESPAASAYCFSVVLPFLYCPVRFIHYVVYRSLVDYVDYKYILFFLNFLFMVSFYDDSLLRAI